MKIGLKIFLSTLLVFILISTILGVVIIENNYSELVNRELNNSISDHKKISNLLDESISYYSLLKWENDIFVNREINKSLKEIVVNEVKELLPKVSSSGIYLELISTDNESSIVSTTPKDWELDIERQELTNAKNGYHSYILRHINDGYYIFVADMITSNFSDNYLVSYIKDISYVDDIRYRQYRIFLIADIIAVILLALVMSIVSKVITNPIRHLIETSESIASGNYTERVSVSNTDEIGALARRFNTMADKVDENITYLQYESERKQRFVDNLTHELKTPLTSIIGYSETLKNKDYDKELFDFCLNHIHNEGKRMKDIIDRMMDIIVIGKESIRQESVDVEILFHEISSIMELKLNRSNTSLKLIHNNEIITADIPLIKQVLINLVDNAIKASKDGDTIVLGAESNDGRVSVYVKDFGIGMEEENLDKILEPFYRIDKSRSRMYGGAGLGLYICNEIVKLHNGSLEVDSKIGYGTKIKIIL